MTNCMLWAEKGATLPNKALQLTSGGLVARASILMVAHTDRGDAVRLISARRATRAERQFYEEG